MKNISQFLGEIQKKKDLCIIDALVDPAFEIPEIHRRVISQGGPALLFTQVKGSPFPVATNLFGTTARIDLAFGKRPEAFVQKAVNLAQHMFPLGWGTVTKGMGLGASALRMGTRRVRHAPVTENEIPLLPGQGLDLLPALTQWPLDGGRFVTLPLVYTEHPVTKKHNLGMYRIQIYDHNTTGMHWQIHKGGGFHYHVAESQREFLPVTLMIGGPPALILSAIAPLPEDVPELLLASLLLGEGLPLVKSKGLPHPLVAECEFAVVGYVPPLLRRPEGPFGDHYGYYSLQHPYPVFHACHMFHRNKAIYPATVVGKPRQEDFFIGEYLQKLLSPLFPLVMPSVKELKSYGETGFHGLAAARVKDRYPREAIASALRILGEGQLSLQKFLMITDADNLDLSDFKAVLRYFLERTNWKTDFFVLSNVAMDTLDYTGPQVNEGSKGIWLALGDAQRELWGGEGGCLGAMPSFIKDAALFIPGCLVVSGHGVFTPSDALGQTIARHDSFSKFEMILLVDDVGECVSSSEKFLWTWFSRFEPAADIYARTQNLNRFHVGLSNPVVFDCRMKPWYPGTVEADAATVALVDRRWREYFPQGP